jgi:hypothetical protein
MLRLAPKYDRGHAVCLAGVWLMPVASGFPYGVLSDRFRKAEAMLKSRFGAGPREGQYRPSKKAVRKGALIVVNTSNAKWRDHQGRSVLIATAELSWITMSSGYRWYAFEKLVAAK